MSEGLIFFVQALAADGDAVLPEDGGDTCVGHAATSADLLSGFVGFVPTHDVGDVLRKRLVRDFALP